MQITRVAHWNESKYIVVSSILFMVPSIHCYMHELYKLLQGIVANGTNL